MSGIDSGRRASGTATTGAPAPLGRSATRRAATAAMGLCIALLAAIVPVVIGLPADAATCPCTIWPAATVPTLVDSGDTNAVEVGLKFTTDVAGYVTGVRFYKALANTGVHQGNLWSAAGTNLATATFLSETVSGWQQVTFAAPVLVAAATTYVVSYFAPAGHYSGDGNFFTAGGVSNPPINALSGPASGGNGVYAYGPTTRFPNQTFNNTNYWVDLVFATAIGSIATTASPDIALGAGTLTDTATVTGRVNPQPGATVTFGLYGPGDATCAGPAIFTATVPYPVAGGPVTSAAFTPTTVGTYRWIASYSGDVNNLPITGTCNDANETTVVNRATPTIGTTASPDITLGAGTLTDVATVSGRVNPQAGATITFSLFGPGNATCTGPPVFISTVAYLVAGGPLTSAAFTPTSAGSYRWIAAYSGDVNNAPVTGACNDANETTVVAPANPTIATNASPDITLGAGTLSDVATVSGRVNPQAGANITFSLFGPNIPTCAGTPAFTSTTPYPVAGGPVTSAAFTPTQAGTYRWIAAYSGDVNNAPVTGACNAANETRVVNQATPTIATTASPDITLGAGTLTDTATVSGRVSPLAGATMTFSLFGPNNATCAGAPIFISTLPYTVAGGPVTSAAFSPTRAGTYRWIAAYSGDANNAPVTGACNDTNESAVVSPASPTIATTASANIVLGAGTLTDSATVSGRINPVTGGTVSFRLYGPNDATCATTPVFQSLDVTYPVAGGPVTSAAFTPTAAGTYRWLANYSGDGNNAAVSGACNDANETRVVARVAATMATSASAGVTLGSGTLTDSATVSGRINPLAGATVSFQLYGPNDATCAGTPAFQSLNIAYPVLGGAVSSGAFTPTQAGTYRWIATYSGDANNAPVVGGCNDANESAVVLAAQVTTTTTSTTGAATTTTTTTAASTTTTTSGGTVAAQSQGQLPRTGSSSRTQVVFAVGLILAGFLILSPTWKRRGRRAPR